MRKLSFLLYSLTITSIFVFGFLLQPSSNQVQATYDHGGDRGWGTCTSTGPQCGTDAGTQSKTITIDRGVEWVCPEGSQKAFSLCWLPATTFIYKDPIITCPENYYLKNNGHWSQRCHRNNNSIQPEHKAPTGTSCPWGYEKIGDGESTQCRATKTSYQPVSKIKQYKSCLDPWSLKTGDESKCEKTITRSCTLPEKDYSACTPAGECPTTCGQPASQVSDGLGGVKQCVATAACEVDICPLLDGIEDTDVQTSLPNGYQLDPENENNCIKTEEPETPEPTVPPEPTPSSSPTPDDGKSGNRSSLSNDNLQCVNSDFDAVMDVKRDGNGVKDVKVVFNFNGIHQETRTNENGRAKVSFVIGNGTLTAEPEGFPNQALNIQAPDCGSTEPGRGGQVLGATTLAETGSQSLYTALLLVVSGVSLSAVSFYGYNQIKKD